MLVTRKSILSGIVRTMDLDINKEQILDYENGALVQHAFPNLTADEREFWLSGATKEEWDEVFEDYEDMEAGQEPDESQEWNDYDPDC